MEQEFEDLSVQQVEEDEDIEDRQRREAELKALVSNAFDDIQLDDSKSFVESICSTSNNDEPVEYVTMEAYKASQDALAQLRVLYKARVSELDALRLENEESKLAATKQVSELQRKVMTYCAESEHLKVSMKQCQNNLTHLREGNIEIKTRLEEQMTTITSLQKQHNEDQQQIATVVNHCSNLEERLALYETGINLNIEESDIEERYTAKIDTLNDALQSAYVSLDKKSNEIKSVNEELTALKYALSDKDDKLIHYETKISSLNEFVTELQDKITNYEQTINKLNERIEYYENQPPKPTTNEDTQLSTRLQEELKRALHELKESRSAMLKLTTDKNKIEDDLEKTMEELRLAKESEAILQSKLIEERQRNLDDQRVEDECDEDSQTRYLTQKLINYQALMKSKLSEESEEEMGTKNVSTMTPPKINTAHVNKGMNTDQATDNLNIRTMQDYCNRANERVKELYEHKMRDLITKTVEMEIQLIDMQRYTEDIETGNLILQAELEERILEQQLIISELRHNIVLLKQEMINQEKESRIEVLTAEIQAALEKANLTIINEEYTEFLEAALGVVQRGLSECSDD